MANYTVVGYAQNAFFTTPEGKLILDPNFDASEDTLRYEIEESDGGVLFNGDDANDEVGDEDQYARKFDANGNQVSEGQVYLEESWTLTDGQGNTVTLYKVESAGAHSGWVADGVITPGKAWTYSGPNNVTADNAPRYDSLVAPTDDPDDANNYTGGSYQDNFVTGAGNDTVDARDGADYVSTGDGNDSVSGGEGNDTIYAGAGDDTVRGGNGDDYIEGGIGNDELHGQSGNDTILGQDGDDTIFAGEGRDYASGGEGADAVYGGADDDTLVGGGGSDTLHGDHGNDDVSGGSGEDSMRGGAGDDTLDGGIGNDTIYGEDGNDFVSGGDDNDLIFGGAGNDTVDGGAGNDAIYGGADNDSLSGGDGDDLIDGGAGDDTLRGGAGNDQLDGGDGNDRIETGSGSDTATGGAGDDTFVQSQDGHTFVTDFDTGDADADGIYNDQLDVSELRTLDGKSVRAQDVIVSEDGSGNAVLTFPEGETITLQGVSAAQMSSTEQLNAAGIPCFTAGTFVQTAWGRVPVETLRVGDLVQTRDNGLREVRWVGQRHLDARALNANPMLRPVHIAAGAFGNTVDIRVSSQHALALGHRDEAGSCVLVRAGHLARLHGGQVRKASGVQSVTYVHLLLDSHDLIMTDGLASESFYPGAWGLMSVGTENMQALCRLLPDLGRHGVVQAYGPTVHPVARFCTLPDTLRALDAVA